MKELTKNQRLRLREINRMCKVCREAHNVSLVEAAQGTDFTAFDLANFENGKSNNALIYDVYLTKFIY